MTSHSCDQALKETFRCSMLSPSAGLGTSNPDRPFLSVGISSSWEQVGRGYDST